MESAEADKPVTFGQRLRAARRNANLTQAQLAEKVGGDAGRINRLETRNTDPKLSTIKKLAEALGVKPADLIGE